MTDGVGAKYHGLIEALCRALEATPKPWPLCSDLNISRAGELCFYVGSATAEQHRIIEDFERRF